MTEPWRMALGQRIRRAKDWADLVSVLEAGIEEAYRRGYDAGRRGVYVKPTMTNAIAGPETVTPRGVR